MSNQDRKKAKKLQEWEEARLKRETKKSNMSESRFAVSYENLYEDMKSISVYFDKK
jgi:hypothetical protein